MPVVTAYAKLQPVISNVLIRLIVAFSMLTGLVLGPTAFAKTAHAPVAPAAAMSMPGHMDCCPDEQPISNCSKCPLMALCSTSVADHVATFRLPSLIARIVRREAPVDEPFRVGRTTAPLPEPPRS